jgi:hypothetical protein
VACRIHGIKLAEVTPARLQQWKKSFWPKPEANLWYCEERESSLTRCCARHGVSFHQNDCDTSTSRVSAFGFPRLRSLHGLSRVLSSGRELESSITHQCSKTIEQRWDLSPLTKRDKAAPSLDDVLTVPTPRTDDPITRGQIPVSNVRHPKQSRPSVLDRVHASRVSLLPLRNEKGTYDQHTPPDLSSSDAIGDYIQMRTAAWSQHLKRFHQKREANVVALQETLKNSKKKSPRKSRKK